MKKMILTATAIITLAGFSLSTARAGDREWATVGKVLTGAVVIDALAHVVIAPCPPAVPVCAAPVVYCPPPAPVCACPVYNYCPPPRVVVIHNWSPSSYGRDRHQMIVYSTPGPGRNDFRHARW